MTTAQTQPSKKALRLLKAYGALDQRARGWQNLPPVNRYSGEIARGNDLVFSMNATTLEIGQGLSGLRGYLWTALLPGSLAMLIGYPVFLAFRWFLVPELEHDWFMLFADFVFVVVGMPMCVLTLAMGFNDLFGYADSPVRFDRARRKVYVWASRKAGPLELDWDRLQPLTQSATALPVQVNPMKTVLLVERDAQGNVLFDGDYPCVAQVGHAGLTREASVAAYEFVRVFMEQGPQALPPVKTYLVWRPRGLRPFVDIFGLMGTLMRSYPSLPKHQRKPGWLVFGVVMIGLFSVALLPLQLAQGIAQRWGNRIPKWGQPYRDYAALGGTMAPPSGAQPNDLPLLPHEKLIATIWVACALWPWVWLLVVKLG
ncbi:DUF6708 domain-containing protein [Hydrogenophaga sp.]|uniref:DUF6708 domain-containing protein n=1 Tax=Hydrogenophaga sp. TaxID=1904254 RepID=UPI00286D82F3|nr:DUF6708 domain-containing protein [Hydrogenophaga sp.]